MIEIPCQNVACGWKGCLQQFGSEIDMNMHVLMNHMVLLDHGEFSLKKRVINRKRPIERDTFENSQRAREPRVEGTVDLISLIPKSSQPVTIRVAANGEAGLSDEKGAAVVPKVEDPEYSSIFEQLMRNQVDTTVGGDDSRQIHDVTAHLDVLDQNALPARSLSDTIDDFLERLRPMKQLGHVRPHKPVYCIVCLKYVASLHECNWKHTRVEDRLAEMWYRRFGKEKPSGKLQLMREFEEIKHWIASEEATLQNNSSD